MASIKDVASKAGVSVATVSRVLNNNPRVKSPARARILATIDQLGYQPSGIARNMRSQSVRVIGLVISDIQNPFFTTLVRAVEDVAYENQYTVLLCNSDEDLQKEQLYIDVLSRERVAGAIIVPTGKDACTPLVNARVPVVMVDRTVPDLVADAVVLDNVAGAFAATKHLIELGHRRIGLVGAPTSVSVGRERQRGYEKALRASKLKLDPRLICIGNFKEQGGYQAARALLELDPRPTAILAVNNLMTLGACQAISEKRLRIPKDISVIGFDDMPWFALLTPPLTAVRQPTYEIGIQAARLLFARMQDAARPVETRVLKPELIVRGSTAAPARG
ncbi:MAG: LacI family DNA-binding transcriptional regulator [Chloroflexi bacterium]|nr:LacI family DNA-binding transcriptional regulator [Chloroflexota bacterium]